jgi:hypothetical protein
MREYGLDALALVQAAETLIGERFVIDAQQLMEIVPEDQAPPAASADKTEDL